MLTPSEGGIYIDRDIFLIDSGIFDSVSGALLLARDPEECRGKKLPAPQVCNAIIAVRGKHNPVLYSVMEHQQKIHGHFQGSLDFGPRAFARTIRESDDIGWIGSHIVHAAAEIAGLSLIVHLDNRVKSVVALHEMGPSRTRYRPPK